jgi:REP element-mobilizing transposase RayT
LRYDNFIPTPRLVQQHSRGRLPHWEVDDAIYFITFRLRDSLPRHVAAALLEERMRLVRGSCTNAERVKLEVAFFVRLDTHLDAHHGSCLLREHGEIVASALKYFDGQRYRLHSWCVMPNHVHVMVHVEVGREVPRILHSWKSYTAHVIGKGVIWQREYFDRVIRSPREFADTGEYIRGNPRKAGLREWAWVE